MNGRILALGAVLMLTAAAVDAQAPQSGDEKSRMSADSGARKGSVFMKGRRAGVSDNDKRRGDVSGDDKARRGGGSAMARGQGPLFSGIELTEMQKTQIRAIREQYRPRFQAIRDTAIALRKDNVVNAADTSIRAKHVALVKSERAEIRAVLTPVQQARFDANVQRIEERMAKRNGFGRTKGKRGNSKS